MQLPFPLVYTGIEKVSLYLLFVSFIIYSSVYRPQCTTVWMLDCSWRCDDILGEHINLKTAERPIQCVECVEESSPILTEEALSKNCIVSTKRHFCLEEYTS